jgi:hypothetical protein
LDQVIEFLPLVGAFALCVLVLVLELPFRRFVFPFIWASLGYACAKPMAAWVISIADLSGRKLGTILFFQGGTVLAILGIAIGESLRRKRVPWRALIVGLGAMSMATMWLASRVLDGYGPRYYHLGHVGAWAVFAGYILGPSALAAFAFVLMAHRIELYEELEH